MPKGSCGGTSVREHNLPVVGITAGDITAYVAKRQQDRIVVRKARVLTLDDGTEQAVPEITKPVSNGEINRELQILKRIFSLAIKSGRIAMRPHITMLEEDNVRTGFFEPSQVASVLAHLPKAIRPVIAFAHITGRRIASEVLPLQWRNVDFQAGEVRLEPGSTKNRKGRTFPFTTVAHSAQHAEHKKLQQAGQITPLIFSRMVAETRGGTKKPRLRSRATRNPADARRTPRPKTSLS